MATIKQSPDGKAWVLDWTEVSGQRRRARIGRIGIMSAREAGLIKKAKELELATGQPMRAMRSSSAVTFAQLATKYLDWHGPKYPASAANVVRNVDTRLVPFFGKHVLEDIDVELVEKYLAKRAQSQSKAATVIKELDTLKAMFKKAVEWRFITHDPVRPVKRPEILDSKPPHFFTPGDLSKIYAVSSEFTPLWRLMVNTGLRRAEALALTAENTAGATVNILSSVAARTKSKKWRAVPIGPGARTALDALPMKGPLVRTMTGHSLSEAFLRDRRAARISKGTLHCLRHTFITQLIQRGVPIRTVQLLAGHSTVAVTERYAHVSPDFMERATSGLDL